ncbi:MAG: hypothetical protein D6704_09070 [Nitrospirae bacterium]|nr:MAG: hypothetical protein D6704_09070 [Nitrospirota bacterium]
MEHGLYLVHGQPLIFGKDQDKGIVLEGLTPKVVPVTPDNQDRLLVHDEQADQPTLAFLLSRMSSPPFPIPLGVFRAITKPTYEDALLAQIKQAMSHTPAPDIQALLEGPETWRVEP